jgi:hypothetical protein
MALNLNAAFRGAATGLAMFASVSAYGQVLQTAGPGPQTVSLAKHCDDIKDVFKLAKFSGEFRQRADAFVAKGCVGDVPLPRDGDSYNIRRFNTSAGILQNGGGIVIAPN